jgi:hypothetical protein
MFESLYKTFILRRRSIRIYCGKTKKAEKGFLLDTVRNRLCTNRLVMDTKAPLEMPVMVTIIANFRYSYRA